MTTLDDLPASYRVILCDLWGCVHNGAEIFPDAVLRLRQWKNEGRRVIFLTNAPRPSSAVLKQLAALRLPNDLFTDVVSSGDAALAWLASDGEGRKLGFIGSEADRLRMEAAGLRFDQGYPDSVLCSGFDARGFLVADYRDELHMLASREVEMICLNPDRVVHRAGVPEPCAGALADAYADMGGIVRWFGKPYDAIYDHALHRVGSYPEGPVARDKVIAIGDSLTTDFLGAAAAGLPFIFVSSGIEYERYRTYGVSVFDIPEAGGAKPLIVVDTLA